MAARVDAGVSAVGSVHELERSLPLAELDLRAEQAERRALRSKELQMLEVRKSLEGQMAVLRPELRGAQADFEDLTSQCEGARGHVNMIMVECDTAAAG